MFNGKINKYRFEYEESTQRIMVYEEGTGVEPISFISIDYKLNEKFFHYEIMSWVTNSGKI